MSRDHATELSALLHRTNNLPASLEYRRGTIRVQSTLHELRIYSQSPLLPFLRHAAAKTIEKINCILLSIEYEVRNHWRKGARQNGVGLQLLSLISACFACSFTMRLHTGMVWRRPRWHKTLTTQNDLSELEDSMAKRVGQHSLIRDWFELATHPD